MATFIDLLKTEEIIRIPEIQRDYAQGRKSSSVVTIRMSFLKTLLLALVDNDDKHQVKLDFVYGYSPKENTVFEPLDGQQRLTTLFLLHWFFLPKGEKRLVKEGKSVFRYSTRKTSEYFCDQLVSVHACSLYNMWKLSKENLSPEKKEKLQFSEYVRTKSWFKWSWRHDPTIDSMLNVIDSIIDLCPHVGIEYEESNLPIYFERLNRISFDRQNLEDLHQGDELYIKMNARGKELSEYDKLKSTLEEEMQIQKVSPKIESEWRERMDGKWLNYFWNKVDKKGLALSVNENDKQEADRSLDIVKTAEKKLRRLLLRLVAVQFQFKPKCQSNFDDDILRGLIDEFIESCLKTSDIDNLNGLIDQYFDLMWWVRRKNLTFTMISFDRLLSDFDALLYSENNNTWLDVTNLVRKEWCDADDDYINDITSYPHQVMFFAILSFVRKYPAESIAKDEGLKEDLHYWMRFIRDISHFNNTLTRIDGTGDVCRAMSVTEKWINTYSEKRANRINYSMRQFVAEDIDYSSTHFGETRRVEEEIIKAKLRSNEEWIEMLEGYENDKYFKGQAGEVLMEWCVIEGNYDLELFKKYTACLKKMIECAADDIVLVQRALLSIRDYKNTTHQGCLGWYSPADKYRSMKRYLRTQEYSSIFKELFDLWITGYSEYEEFIDFANCLITQKEPLLYGYDWRKWALKEPMVLCYGRQVVVDNDVKDLGVYTFLALKQSKNSTMKEVFLYYLSLLVKAPFTYELDDYRNMENGQGEHVLIVRDSDKEVYRVGMAGEKKYYLHFSLHSIDKTLEADEVCVEIEKYIRENEL